MYGNPNKDNNKEIMKCQNCNSLIPEFLYNHHLNFCKAINQANLSYNIVDKKEKCVTCMSQVGSDHHCYCIVCGELFNLGDKHSLIECSRRNKNKKVEVDDNTYLINGEFNKKLYKCLTCGEFMGIEHYCKCKICHKTFYIFDNHNIETCNADLLQCLTCKKYVDLNHQCKCGKCGYTYNVTELHDIDKCDFDPSKFIGNNQLDRDSSFESKKIKSSINGNKRRGNQKKFCRNCLEYTGFRKGKWMYCIRCNRKW